MGQKAGKQPQVQQLQRHGEKNRAGLRWGRSLLPLLLLLAVAAPVAAQQSTEQPPDNTLEMPVEGDSLAPRLPGNRPLTPLEAQELRAALEDLNQRAIAERQAGNVTTAFQIWFRELRLRRLLGPTEEVQALARVGAIAWEENLTPEVRLITQRLQEIEQQTTQENREDYERLVLIAQGYQSLRAYDPAVALYNRLLEQARETGFREGEQQILSALALLHFSWFNYSQAAATYQELRAIARQQQDSETERTSLHQLVLIYERTRQPEQAIATLQELMAFYQPQQPLAIAGLKLAIGDQYRALNRNRDAAASYQEAFALARTTQQSGLAGDALQRLADLYRSINQPNDALTVYRLLLEVHRLSYNWAGMMETFAQIGQLYQAAGDRPSAVFAYQQALQLAEQLNYRRKINQFSTQIQTLNQQ